jgi:LytS/YehU family sensor histidine kinase
MRSDTVTKGKQQAPHRSLMNALGLTKEEMDRPLVGIVSSYNEIVPGHMNLDKIVNAVKHGVGRKIGGGTVTIHTYETENDYIIRITDDGVGFVEGEYADDSGTHVGIENTKKRLDMMINAKMEIESNKGKGTTVCVLIPKRRD